MNLKQIPYILGWPFYALPDGLMLSMAAVLNGPMAYDDFSQGKIAHGLVNCFLSLYAAKMGIFMGLRPRIQLSRDIVTISHDEAAYPLESNETVVIRDHQGLEELLQKTNEKRSREWGTVLKAEDEAGTSVISKILSPEQAHLEGYTVGEKLASVRFDRQRINEGEYTGIHHYHPTLGLGLGTRNFTVSAVDRVGLDINSLFLLSFSTSYGPELIAYNRRYVYLPTDDTKREFQRASPKDIIRYLAEK